MGSIDPGALHMNRVFLASRLLATVFLALAFGSVAAQPLPVGVTASGNQATVVIGASIGTLSRRKSPSTR